MPFLTWNLRRQLVVFAIFAAVVLLVVGGFIYYFRPEPTCFDKRQNQDEEGVDCGGAIARCAPCSEKIRDLTILWTRFFPVREGVVDVAAMLENQNQFLKTSKLVYAVKLYDKDNVLIAIKENSTFAHPAEKFLIFESSISVQNRIPHRAILELRSVLWESAEPQPLKIDVISQNLELISTPSRIEVRVKNRSEESYKNIELSAVILGKNEEVLGVSRSILEQIGISEERDISFTWPNPIEGGTAAKILVRQIL